MSFRSLFVTVALFIAPVSAVCAQEAVAPPEVANSKFQIEGAINAESVVVRSGPGEGYYSTQQLTKGSNVTVVGIKLDWLKIVPPEGSFSYVGAVFVDRVAGSNIGKINRNDVNVRAGSLVNAMKTTVQTRLNAGDTVQILGTEDEYLKIKPPTGAYLYINKEFVTISRPAVAADSGAITTSTPAGGDAAKAAVASAQTGDSASDGKVAEAPTTRPDVTASGNTAPSIDGGAIVTSTPTTAPSNVAIAPSTQPSQVAVAPQPSAEELFGKYEDEFTKMSQTPLETQSVDELVAKYQTIAKADGLSSELKKVVAIRIATLQVRSANKTKLIEARQFEKQASEKRLALQAEQQELAERLKQSEIQVFAAVGTLQPSSLQLGGGTLYRLTDPGTGRTVVYIRTADTKITALMGQFIGVTGDVATDPQLNLRVIAPTNASVVEPAKVNVSVMAGIVPPSLLARQASAN